MHFNDITKIFVLISNIKIKESTQQIFKDSVPYCTVQESTAYRTVLMYRTHAYLEPWKSMPIADTTLHLKHQKKNTYNAEDNFSIIFILLYL